MLRLYYSESKYFEVGSFPISLYMKLRITEMHDDIGRAWQNAMSFTEISASTGSDISLSDLRSLSTRTRLYLSENNERPTNFYVQFYSQMNYYIFAWYYKDIVIARFRVYSDWITDNSKFCLMSAFSNPESYDTYTDAEIWYFINAMFEFEQKIKAGGEYSVEQLGQVPLLFPFIPSHVVSEDLVFQKWELYADGSVNLMPHVCSAASIASNLLGKEIVQTSQMTTKSGTKFHPATVYDPDMWNSKTHTYDYENSENSADAFTAWNAITSVFNNSAEDVNTQFFGTQVTQQVYMQFPFVQVFDLYQPNFATDFDMSQNSDLIGIKNSWIDRLVESYSSGDKIYCVLQTRDYASLKNAALIHKSGFDALQVQTGDYASISCVAFMLLSRIYNNFTASFTTRSIAQVTALGTGTTNELTGNDIIEHFFNADETPDKPEIPEAPPVVPPDDGGGGTTDNEEIGGGGTWSDTGDDTTVSGSDMVSDKIAGVPEGTFGGLSTNTILLKMTSPQLKKLMDVMWSEDFLDWFKNKFGRTDLNEGVLQILYGNLNTKSGAAVSVNGIGGFRLTPPLVAARCNQFQRFDCGSVEVPGYFGSFLDFEPYTQITLYLPKVPSGIAIPASLAVGKKINVILTVDVISGIGVYIIQNDDKTQIATVECQALENLPYSGRDWNGLTSTSLQNVVQAATNFSSTVLQEHMSEYALASAELNSAMIESDIIQEAIKVSYDVATNFSQAWNKGSASRLGGINVPILKIARTYVQYPTWYKDMLGYPTSQITRIGNCKGYFECSKIYADFAIPADELDELIKILQTGAYA